MKAVIVGAAGQDGRLLAENLRARGHTVLGVTRRGSVDILDARAVRRFMARVKPDQVYYLAAYHHSAQERQPKAGVLLKKSLEVHALGLSYFLAALGRAKLFYAASSHVFGNPKKSPQDESTPLAPENPYALTKTVGIHLCRLYRARGAFASVGILYNHESPLRGPEFVSRKIAIAAARGRKLTLGDLSARVDWGWAPDYVEAMRRVLALSKPGDFVIATGRARRVRDFAREAYAAAGLDWRRFVAEDRRLIQKEKAARVGSPRKLRRATGWKPRTSFKDMVRALVLAERSLPT